MKAILRYLGAKNRLAPWVISHFPPHRCYTEPYGGSAGVLLNKTPSPIEIYNDLDSELVNLFKILRTGQLDQLVTSITYTPYSREELANASPVAEPLEKARRLLIRSFFGIASDSYRNYGSGFRTSKNRVPSNAADWATLPDRIKEAAHRLKYTCIENRPALEILKNYDSKDTLHYIDPPYMPETRTRTGRYNHELTEAEHHFLLMTITTLKGKVALSGYDTALYNSHLTGWRKATKDDRSNMGKRRQECLWMNY